MRAASRASKSDLCAPLVVRSVVDSPCRRVDSSSQRDRLAAVGGQDALHDRDDGLLPGRQGHRAVALLEEQVGPVLGVADARPEAPAHHEVEERRGQPVAAGAPARPARPAPGPRPAGRRRAARAGTRWRCPAPPARGRSGATPRATPAGRAAPRRRPSRSRPGPCDPSPRRRAGRPRGRRRSPSPPRAGCPRTRGRARARPPSASASSTSRGSSTRSSTNWVRGTSFAPSSMRSAPGTTTPETRPGCA